MGSKKSTPPASQLLHCGVEEQTQPLCGRAAEEAVFAGVLLIYYCATNHHRLSSRKQPPAMTSHFLCVSPSTASLGPALLQGCHQGVGQIAIWRLDWGRICIWSCSGCCQSSFPGGHAAEDTGFLLAVCGKPSSAPRGGLQCLATRAFPTRMLISSSQQRESPRTSLSARQSLVSTT